MTLNLNKLKSKQPDYTGAILYVDEDNKEHRIYASAWVNKTRAGNLLSLVVQPYAEYMEACKRLLEERERKEKQDVQRLRRQRQRVIEEREFRKVASPDCGEQYFGVVSDTEQGQDEAEKPTQDDNPS